MIFSAAASVSVGPSIEFESIACCFFGLALLAVVIEDMLEIELLDLLVEVRSSTSGLLGELVKALNRISAIVADGSHVRACNSYFLLLA